MKASKLKARFNGETICQLAQQVSFMKAKTYLDQPLT
jgi:hypothetical protein